MSEIPEEGTPYRFDAGELRIVVIKLSGIYFAVDSTCPHEEADLSLGVLNDEVLMCPLHQARFDVRNGKVINGPNGDDPDSIAPLCTYVTKVDDKNLYIQS